jgi:hypothetical protein
MSLRNQRGSLSANIGLLVGMAVFAVVLALILPVISSADSRGQALVRIATGGE